MPRALITFFPCMVIYIYIYIYICVCVCVPIMCVVSLYFQVLERTTLSFTHTHMLRVDDDAKEETMSKHIHINMHISIYDTKCNK